MTFAREAWPFAGPPAVAALALAVLRQWWWALAAAAIALLLLAFFRIPRRRPPADSDDLLAPANGRVTRVDRVAEPALGAGRYHRVVTFLSVFDVHLQRAPTAGEVASSAARGGRKVAAFRDDADELNESRLTVIRRTDGLAVGVRQIVGLLARRIVCYLEPGSRVARGQPLGLIKFGSRVDLLFPDAYQPAVRPGQRVREGETVVARRRSEP